MIVEPTVLVLGAGASVDYGFPTGRELLLEICTDGRRGKLRTFLHKQMGYSEAEIDEFTTALMLSGAPSVDLFLEHRREFEQIGKAAIAAALIPLEESANLFPAPNRRWYETLFGLMAEDGPFQDNLLSILTFNYDRSLEAYLFKALTNLYRMEENNAETIISRHVIHLHGSLGETLLPSNRDRGYAPECLPEWVKSAANRIKIVHEAEPKSAEFQRAHDLLAVDGIQTRETQLPSPMPSFGMYFRIRPTSPFPKAGSAGEIARFRTRSIF